MNYRYLSSPLGSLLLAGDSGGLRMLGLPEGKGAIAPDPDWTHDPHGFTDAARQLDEYFAGSRRAFELRLTPHGTPFQREVLRALARIPYGETRSYREVAEQIGRPRAVRAVGAANGRNPLPILIPCHRVIGADGRLTGYGGGLTAKARLLALEGAVIA